MKKTHILAILAIAVCLAFVVGNLFESSSYADFEEAWENPNTEFHVVGQLDRSEPVIYEPEVNPSLTQFTMIDNLGVKKKVMLYKSKPQDFDKSESVVLIGKAGENAFEADDILLKCPSKYEEEGTLETAEARN